MSNNGTPPPAPQVGCAAVSAAEQAAPALLRDQRGRTVRYVRLSVTDRCNLRCMYCRSNAKERCIPHADVLRYEEMLRVVEAAVGMGIEKIRLTGGEPFARKGFVHFLEMLRGQFPAIDIRITTNATMVRPHVAQLKALAINAVNVSLDSFTPLVFAAVTGQDMLAEVRATLDAIMAAGIQLKINAVGLRGINDGEMAQFIDFARQNPVDVRFIEFMPMGSDTHWSEQNFWSADAMLEAATRCATLTPLADATGTYAGPAKMYTIEGGVGRFGLITPLSNHFCSQCNRLRITSEGHLRTCLFADHEYALRGILRHPRLGIAHVQRVLAAANRVKPLGAEILQARGQAAVARKRMVAIGG